MNKYKIIAICGKSASGKDTLLHKIVEQNPELHEIISCTTRPPREGEIDGRNYFFLTDEEFKEKYLKGEMLEVSKFRNWNYGTSLDGLNSNIINVGVFNPEGIRSLVADKRVLLFVVKTDASDKTRMIRSLLRETDPDVDEIVRRYTTDKVDFEKFSQLYEPEYTVGTENMSLLDLNEVAYEIPLLARSHWAEEIN